MASSISVQSTPTKYNGRVHNRKDELKAHRKTIDSASKNMEKAILAGDYEAADRWSSVIDGAQGYIFEIIDQENGHSYKKPETYKNYVKATTEGIDSVVDSGVKVVGVIPQTALKTAGEIIDTVA